MRGCSSDHLKLAQIFQILLEIFLSKSSFLLNIIMSSQMRTARMWPQDIDVVTVETIELTTLKKLRLNEISVIL